MMGVRIESGAGIEPLTKPRIGYHDVLRDATLTASSAASGFPASSTQLSMTYEKWRPTALPATLTYTFDLQTITYVGVGAHDLKDTGCDVTLELRISGEWVTIDDETFPDNDEPTLSLNFVDQEYYVYEKPLDKPIFWLLSPHNTDGIRLTFDGTSNPSIGVVYAGRVLEMQRGIYGGHTPGDLSRNTEIRPNLSEGGQFVGRSVVRRGLGTGLNFENLSANWYRLNFEPFVEAAITDPYFIAWHPSVYLEGVLYGSTDDDISPSNQGQRDLMSVSFNVRGLG